MPQIFLRVTKTLSWLCFFSSFFRPGPAMAETPREIRRKHGQHVTLGCSGHGERTALDFDSLMQRRHSAKVPCPHHQDAAANGIAGIRFKLAGRQGRHATLHRYWRVPRRSLISSVKLKIPRLLLRTARVLHKGIPTTNGTPSSTELLVMRISRRISIPAPRIGLDSGRAPKHAISGRVEKRRPRVIRPGKEKAKDLDQQWLMLC
ncbi:hypothetical protein GGI42DRAFT_20648 [Trichoderma sp. SZMC 28013]